MKIKGKRRICLVLLTVLLLALGVLARAESLSGDNSLASLGITTEGAEVSPEFYYSTIEYTVTVPAGTTALSLDPVLSNSTATIDSITGTELTDGATTVVITITAENGSSCAYYLYVTADESASASEQTVEASAQELIAVTQTEQAETEAETEDPRYVKVARETLEDAESTISSLKEEKLACEDKIDFMTKIIYGLIGLCVLLFFVVLNLMISKHGIKKKLAAYQSLGYVPKKVSKKEQKRAEKEEREAEKAQRKAEKEEERAAKKEKKPKNQDDDPATVPKPEKAKKQTKRMPEYEKPQAKEKPRFEPNPSARSKVDVDFIDL